MIRTATAFTAILMATAAHAEASVDDKLCIFSAAQKLPQITGLTIAASRMKDLPANPQAKGTTPTRIVEIDVKAAGQDATFQFICASSDKATVTSPLGVAR